MKISLSVLGADFLNFRESVRGLFENSDYIHLDIMDGEFVPNISFGPGISKTINSMNPKENRRTIDTHLMLLHPQKYLNEFKDAGSDYITFHIEADCNPIHVINRIKELGAKPGIAINPETPVSKIYEYLGMVDLVLVMSVNPGRGGQPFMECAIDKVKELKELKIKNNYNYLINIDGGINKNTINLVKDYIDLAVVGSALTNIKEYDEKVKAIEELKAI